MSRRPEKKSPHCMPKKTRPWRKKYSAEAKAKMACAGTTSTLRKTLISGVRQPTAKQVDRHIHPRSKRSLAA